MKKRIIAFIEAVSICIALLGAVSFFWKEGVAGLPQAQELVSIFISPTPLPTPTPLPVVLGEQSEQELVGELATVAKIVDGDTIELVDGRKVRYIGVDTPESKKPNTPVQCYALEAAERNRQLVEGKQVVLVKDKSETDRYQRLLRYVYVGDVFVNETLVAEGYAIAKSYPPDTAQQTLLRETERVAKEADKGLWGHCPS